MLFFKNIHEVTSLQLLQSLIVQFILRKMDQTENMKEQIVKKIEDCS